MNIASDFPYDTSKKSEPNHTKQAPEITAADNVRAGSAKADLATSSSGGQMTVVAGNGIQGFSGDGGPSTSASLNQPSGVAVDAAGNLYIADFNNNRIRKVSPAGTITTFAGNGVAAFAGDGGPYELHR